jgi:hypothetical protein
MTRILATLLVALLVASAPMTAVVGGVGPPTSGPDDVATASLSQTEVTDHEGITWITTGSDARAGSAEHGADLGSALAMGDTEFRTQIRLGTVERAFENAESTEERQAILDEHLDEIKDRTVALHEREAALAAAYSNGEMDDSTLVRDIAEVSKEARTLRSAADTVDELAATDPEVTVSVRNIKGDLSRFDSPIRTQLLEATYGNAERAGPIQISAAENTLVLSTLDESISDNDDRIYVREGVQFDRFAPDEPPTFESLTELDDRGPELYPWIYSNLFGLGISGYDRLIALNLDHPRGESTSHIDFSTQEVVMEYHTLTVDSLSTTATVSRTNENATVSSHRVSGGGPVWVAVTGPDSDEPVDATVSVAGQQPVETGENGTAWLLAPEGDVEVTATTDAGEVSITVRE